MEPDKAFYCRDGKVARSLDDLTQILTSMPEDEFSHHVNEYKNDFANWIEHVLGERDLADTLRKAQSRQEIIFTVNERIMRRQVSQGLRAYTERQEPRLEAAVAPAVTVVEERASKETLIPQTPPKEDALPKQDTHVSRREDYQEHPYKYFTLREFILGVLLGFVLGFVVSKLVFGLLQG